MADDAFELMRARVEAHYTHDSKGRIVSLNQWDGGGPPRFYLGRTAGGNVWRFGDGVPNELATELDRLCQQEPVCSDLHAPPSYERDYQRLLSTHRPVELTWAGPAFLFPERFPADDLPRTEPVAITEVNADLLRGGMEEWLPDVPYRRPFMALVIDQRVVSVCVSVRITPMIHEAGVETLVDCRRRGYAASVVAGWAEAVRDLGAEPIYSTSWSNRASLSVAARLGLEPMGVDFHLT